LDCSDPVAEDEEEDQAAVFRGSVQWSDSSDPSISHAFDDSLPPLIITVKKRNMIQEESKKESKR